MLNEVPPSDGSTVSAMSPVVAEDGRGAAAGRVVSAADAVTESGAPSSADASAADIATEISSVSSATLSSESSRSALAAPPGSVFELFPRPLKWRILLGAATISALTPFTGK
jgi:hypothetical protein